MFLQLPDESRRELEDSLDSDEDDIDDDTTSSQVNSNYGRDASKTTKPTNQRGGGNLNRDPTRCGANETLSEQWPSHAIDVTYVTWEQAASYATLAFKSN